MKNTSEITALVYDHGLFLPLARQLAKHFKRVLYHSPWVESFPTLNKCIIGDGFPDIERCDDIWDCKQDVDLFVFPDIYDSGLQRELESQGFPVWGSKRGDMMEIYRQRFIKALEKRGFEVAKHTVITGLTQLRIHLVSEQDKYIKISKYRGSLETTHWRDWKHDEGLLDQWSVKFGPAKELIQFIVFDSIETDLEIGGDTYCIDGQYPEQMVNGFEWKDKGYFGTVTDTPQMPEQILEVNQAFSQELAEVRYRNFISSEIRVAGDKFYFIDPTRRMPCPAGSSQMMLYSNLGDIIWRGANGELVQPEMAGKFAAECVLTSKCEKGMWVTAEFDDALADHVFMGNSCMIDGAYAFPPTDQHGEELGWLVVVGDTPQETIDSMLEKSKLLPDGVCANTESLVDLLKEMNSAQDEGIPVTNQELPQPESVIANE